METKDHKTKQSPCPFCTKKLDGAIGGKKGPKPGDITVCAYCVNWLVFDDDLCLRPLEEDEIVELDNETFSKLSAYSKLMRNRTTQ